VQVNERGEIKFDQAGESFIFRHAGNPLPPGTKCLAYHSARAPQCVHLTTGKGEILGTWAQRGRTAFQDREALAEAIRYTGAARAAVTAEATELAAQSRQRFEDIRAHNAALEKFVTVTDAPRAAGTLPASATARALATTEETTDAMREQPPTVEPVADCTEDVLERQSSAPDVTFD
jgi:hypothetical protein